MKWSERGFLSPSFPEDPSTEWVIPALRLRAGSCHTHIAQTGWSCPVTTSLQINLMSTLPLVLGWRKESGGWEQGTAQT